MAAKQKAAAASTPRTTRSIEDRLRSAAAPSRYSGTIARGTATGPDPFISNMRRKIARGESLTTSATSTKAENEKSARKKVSGQ